MAVEQVAEIPSGQETRRGDIATRKGYRSPSRRALRFDYRSRSQQRANRISMALWTRNTTATAKSFLFALLRDIAPAAARGFSTSRAHIYRRKMQRGQARILAARTKRPGERGNRYFEAEASFSSRRAIVRRGNNNWSPR